VLTGLAVCALMSAACGAAAGHDTPRVVQPGPPGEPSRLITADAAADLPVVRHTAADVRFMQAMIPHHAQALDMAALVPGRSSRDDVQRLAARIELSQADEMRMMRRWLEARGEAVPGAHVHQLHGAAPMPGMLSTEDMRRLADTRGEAFDRLFLALMIRHHEGALVMVRDLFAAGGGQDPEVFALASEVESEQTGEIARMRTMLAR
jgi:uncharacterized protein (DUF305 family)